MYQQKLNGEFNLAKLQPKKVDKFIRSLKGITDSKEDNMQYVTYPNATEFNGATIECKSTIGYEDIATYIVKIIVIVNALLIFFSSYVKIL